MKSAGYLLLPMLCLCLSCADKPDPSLGILPEKKMVDLLVDSHLADAILFTDNGSPEEKQKKAMRYYTGLLEKHGVTKAQMDSSVAWYMRHPDAFNRVYNKVVQNLENRKAAIKKTERKEE